MVFYIIGAVLNGIGCGSLWSVLNVRFNRNSKATPLFHNVQLSP